MSIQTGNDYIDVKLEDLLAAIENKDIVMTERVMEELLDLSLTNLELVGWIITPANLTMLHNALIEAFEIHPRTMMLKKRSPHRQRRAYMFIRAMLNGIYRAPHPVEQKDTDE